MSKTEINDMTRVCKDIDACMDVHNMIMLCAGATHVCIKNIYACVYLYIGIHMNVQVMYRARNRERERAYGGNLFCSWLELNFVKFCRANLSSRSSSFWPLMDLCPYLGIDSSDCWSRR